MDEAEIHGWKNSKQPQVINKDLLISLVVNQGPKDEAAEYFHEEGVKLGKVQDIRIEFLNIIHINFLWPLKNLRKLSLSNNAIEKIENMETLINLRELNLSFNHIETIENLDDLINIETLSLHANKITIVKGLDTMENLKILSIGKNKINDCEHILYLRKFQKLRSFSSAGNPCLENPEYSEYAIAIIPQLVYFQYQLVSEDARSIASNKYVREIDSLIKKELSEKTKLDLQKQSYEQSKLAQAAFVEHLDKDCFFERVFENVNEMKTLKAADENINENFKVFKQNFFELCNELHTRGLEEHEKRTNDINLYNSAVEDGKLNYLKTTRTLMENTGNKGKSLSEKLSETLKNLAEQNDEDENLSKNVWKVNVITEEFNELTTETWNEFMKNEMIFHRQMMDINETLKKNMDQMTETFSETAQNYFEKMRNLSSEFNAILRNKSSNKRLAEIDFSSEYFLTFDEHLKFVHDTHLQMINERETQLMDRSQNWLRNFNSEHAKKEHERHRSRILEAAHFLEFLKKRFSVQLKNVDEINGLAIAATLNLEI